MNKNLTINNLNDLENKIVFFKANDYFGVDKQNRIAVFDLDNTLLIGDIGDAVFSMLKIQGYSLGLSWDTYLNILKNDGKEVAYSKVVAIMAGLSIDTIHKITENVLKSTQKSLEVEGVSVPIPKVHPIMYEFIELLKRNDFKIYVISATNIFSVRLICKYLFELDEKNCFGIEPETIKKNKDSLPAERILTGKIKEPLTITIGKEDLYWDKISKIRPLITAGDSESDIHLLNLVNSNGFSLWVGNDIERYRVIREKSKIKEQFYYFER